MHIEHRGHHGDIVCDNEELGGADNGRDKRRQDIQGHSQQILQPLLNDAGDRHQDLAQRCLGEP